MASQSKPIASGLKDILIDMLIGSKKKKMVSGAILLIIGFLIHVQSMKSGADMLRLKPRDKDSKKVKALSYFRKEEKETLMRCLCPE